MPLSDTTVLYKNYNLKKKRKSQQIITKILAVFTSNPLQTRQPDQNFVVSKLLAVF